MEKGKKPFYKKTWFLVLAGLIVLGIIGNALSKKEEAAPMDIAEEANLIYERILNPESMEQLLADYERAETLFEEIKQANNQSDAYVLAKINLEAVITYKETNIKNAEQKLKLKELFDEYHGGFKVVNKAIKRLMHDPNSFEHVNTKYEVKDNKIIFYTEYRGKNAFNATVLNSITGVMDLDGNILEIVTE